VSSVGRRVAEALMVREGTSRAWSLVLEEVREGYARVSMRIRPDMLNGFHTIHGGMIFSLADSAFAYACNSRNETSVAQTASILFLEPAYEGDELVAEAVEDARHGRSGAYNVAVRTRDGQAIAQFQGLSRTLGRPILSSQDLL
jgi:acyl-CoA thioesterase